MSANNLAFSAPGAPAGLAESQPRMEAKAPRRKDLLEKGALVMLWFIGTFTVFKLLAQFQSTLTPAVFAVFLVACMEPAVKKVQKLFLCFPCMSCRRRMKVAKEKDFSRSDAWEDKFLNAHTTMSSLARISAVMVVIAVAVTFVWGFCNLCIAEIQHLHDRMYIYQNGLVELSSGAIRTFNSTIDRLPEQIQVKIRKEMSSELAGKSTEQYVQTAGNFVGGMIKGILASSEYLGAQIFLCFLYVLFSLVQPPAHEFTDNVQAIVKRYLFLKTCTNACYSVCIWLLLFICKVDLAVFFALLSWFLNFIPELGPFISMAIPIPLIMLDSQNAMSERCRIVLIVVLGQLAVKFLVSNILETVLFGNDEQFGETHPVLVLLFAMVCGELWGATGMLVSVPLLAVLKVMLEGKMAQDGKLSPEVEKIAAASGLAKMKKAFSRIQVLKALGSEIPEGSDKTQALLSSKDKAGNV